VPDVPTRRTAGRPFIFDAATCNAIKKDHAEAERRKGTNLMIHLAAKWKCSESTMRKIVFGKYNPSKRD
jgi:hypothetical protein